MTTPQCHHMNWEDFRRCGHATIDWIADYHAGIEKRPVMSRVTPGQIRSSLPPHPPQKGEAYSTMLADLEEKILPGITHWQSPNFFAYWPSNVSGPSILGELLSAGLGVQGMLWITSPACTELETHVLDWVAGMLGLPDTFTSGGTGGGVIQDTASSATLCALLASRERASGYRTRDTGVDTSLVAYATAHTHSSMAKAMLVSGLGTENLRLIDTSPDGGMQPGGLARAVDNDREAGRKPLFVCATVGSTSTGAIDPIAGLSQICREKELWLHIDAAMFGSAAICPEFRWIQNGVEHADSYCFNPHKWLCTNFDCTCFFVADREGLLKTLGILPEYLRNRDSESGSVIDYRDWQIPLGRRFRALKLWFVIRHYGVDGLQAMIREHVRLAELFESRVEASDHFMPVAPRHLNLVCFRHEGGDEVNEDLLRAINASGRQYLTHTRVGDAYALRMCVGQAWTRAEHVEAAWTHLEETARNLP